MMPRDTKRLNKGNPLRFFFVCVLIAAVISAAYYYSLEKQTEKNIDRVRTIYTERAENVIDSIFHKTDVLAAVVKLKNGDISKADFRKIARIVYRKNSGIRGIQYMPGAVVTYSYPLKGNEAVMYSTISETIIKMKNRTDKA